MCYRTIFVDRFNAVSLNFLKMRNQVRAHWFILHHEHLKVVKFIRSISVNGGLWCRETQLTFFAFFKSLSLSLPPPPFALLSVEKPTKAAYTINYMYINYYWSISHHVRIYKEGSTPYYYKTKTTKSVVKLLTLGQLTTVTCKTLVPSA